MQAHAFLLKIKSQFLQKIRYSCNISFFTLDRMNSVEEIWGKNCRRMRRKQI